MVVHCKQRVSHENEPQNRQKIVTLMNNKVAAVSKTMELPGDK